MRYEWSDAIRCGDQQLGEFIGKASANVWLYDDLDNFDEVQTTFLLALKYYRQRRNKSSRNSEKITDLSATGFRDISIWAGGQKRHIKNGSLGVAYFTLHEWEACIQCFRKEVNSNPDEFTLWRHFGEAYEAKGDHDAAIKTFEAAVDKFPTEWRLWDRLSDAYKRRTIMMQRSRRWRPLSTSFRRNRGYGID